MYQIKIKKKKKTTLLYKWMNERVEHNGRHQRMKQWGISGRYQGGDAGSTFFFLVGWGGGGVGVPVGREEMMVKRYKQEPFIFLFFGPEIHKNS